MSPISVANAPVSWGAIMFEGFGEDGHGYNQVMDEIAELTPSFHGVSFEFLDRGCEQGPDTFETAVVGECYDVES